MENMETQNSQNTDTQRSTQGADQPGAAPSQGADQTAAGLPGASLPAAGPEEQKRAVIMSLAVIFLFFVSPLAGFLIATGEQPFLKEQSRLALNGTITYGLFLMASFVLNVTVILSIIGIPLMALAFVLTLYGGIKGAVESSHGRLYRYPMSLNLVR